MKLSANSVDIVIRKAQRNMPEPAWQMIKPVVDAIRQYALMECEDEAGLGAALAIQLGRVMALAQLKQGDVHFTQPFVKATQILMSLINLRAPGATDVERAAAERFAFPSAWDRLNDDQTVICSCRVEPDDE